MARASALIPLVAGLATAGCTCGSKASPAVDAASEASIASGPGPTASAPAALSAGADAPVFSAPIAAARVGGAVVVAGLVAAEGVVRVTGRDEGGSWTADAMRGVAWSADAELTLQAAGTGVAVLWRGLREGKSGRSLAVLGPRGEAIAAPIEVGTSLCTTADGVAWIDAGGGATHVRSRRWSDPVAHDVDVLKPDRDPSLVCGAHGVFVLGDGDDDVTASTFMPGEAAGAQAVIAIRDADFGDEEREHDAYSTSDTLGLVRVGGKGTLAIRELPLGGSLGPWRRLKSVLSEDDDVVAVDGDATATVVVFTHDTDDACPGLGSSATSVRAVFLDRKSDAEALLDLAAADCDRARGPFWFASSPGGPLVAWVERNAKTPASAPIAGVAFSPLRADAHPTRVEQPADAVVDAGCDDHACAAAALVREPDSDGMRPAPIRLLSFQP
jgi:hypothetical protein